MGGWVGLWIGGWMGGPSTGQAHCCRNLLARSSNVISNILLVLLQLVGCITASCVAFAIPRRYLIASRIKS
jgi:hypothetical protein